MFIFINILIIGFLTIVYGNGCPSTFDKNTENYILLQDINQFDLDVRIDPEYQKELDQKNIKTQIDVFFYHGEKNIYKGNNDQSYNYKNIIDPECEYFNYNKSSNNICEYDISTETLFKLKVFFTAKLNNNMQSLDRIIIFFQRM